MSFINYLEIIQNDGSAISCFNPVLVQDMDKEDYQQLAVVAVRNTPKALSEILFDQVTDQNAIIQEAFKTHDVALRYTPKEMLTQDMYQLAVSLRPLALLLVPTEFQTVEMCDQAVQAKPYISKFVKINKVCDSDTMMAILHHRRYEEIRNYSSFDLDEVSTKSCICRFNGYTSIPCFDFEYMIPRLVNLDTFIKYVYEIEGNQVVSNHLIKFGVDLNRPINNNGMRPIHYACKNHAPITLKGLLDYDVDVNYPDNNGMYPIHHLVKAGYMHMKVLLDHPKLNKNVKDRDGNTALHLACLNTMDSLNNNIISMLLEKKYDMFGQNKNHEMPLQLLCDYRGDDNEYRVKAVKLFLKEMEKHLMPLVLDACTYAVYNYNIALVKTILEWIKPNGSYRAGYTNRSIESMFMMVFKENCQLYSNCPIEKRLKMAQLLLDTGVSVNYVNAGDKKSSLHMAAISNNEVMVKFLLNAGADKEMVDTDNKRAVNYAVDNKNIYIVKMLI